MHSLDSLASAIYVANYVLISYEVIHSNNDDFELTLINLLTGLDRLRCFIFFFDCLASCLELLQILVVLHVIFLISFLLRESNLK